MELSEILHLLDLEGRPAPVVRAWAHPMARSSQGELRELGSRADGPMQHFFSFLLLGCCRPNMAEIHLTSSQSCKVKELRRRNFFFF